jgi:hypothetical protein
LNEDREADLRKVQERIAVLPGIVAVVPQNDRDGFVEVAVHPSDRISGSDDLGTFSIRTRAAPPGFFSLMGFRLVQGREFTQTDRQGSLALVIGSDLARRFWGSADPIGRRLVHAAANQGTATAFVVVGVVDEARAPASDGGEPQVFVPTLGTTGSILVRTRGPAQPMIPLIRALALAEAPRQPVVSVMTLAAIESGRRTVIARLSSVAVTTGILGLFLCAVGLYAVVAFAVGQRVREIGIRTALGADPGKVARMFFLRGLRLSIVGLVTGLSLCFAVLRMMAAVQGEEPEPGTALIAIAVTSVVIGVAAIATWIPARRAAGIDPLNALSAD